MDIYSYADLFSQDIDRLLDSDEKLNLEPVTDEYQETIALAYRLLAWNFGNDEHARQNIKRRVLGFLDTRGRMKQGKEYFMSNIRRRYVVGLLVGLSIVLVISVAAFAFPDIARVAAREAAHLIQQLWVRSNTLLSQVDPSRVPPSPPTPLPPGTVIVEQRDDIWIVRTSIGNFAGDILPGQNPVVLRFGTFEEAQTVTSFGLKELADLPADFALHEAMVTPMGWVFFFYRSPDGEIIFGQLSMGAQPGDSNGQLTSVVGTLSDQPIELVTLSGQPAGWIEGAGLTWKTDGISYLVGGAKLSLEEAIHIAESMK